MDRLSTMIYQTNLLFDTINSPENKKMAFHHAFMTLKAVKHIAQIEQVQSDLIEIAAYMHDCQLYFKSSFSHAQQSASKAYQLLQESQLFSEEECQEIQSMIKHHSLKDQLHSKNDEIIKNADLLAKYLDHEMIDEKYIKRISPYI